MISKEEYKEYLEEKIKDVESSKKYLQDLGINNNDGSLTELFGGDLKYEEKFIVINKKRLSEVSEKTALMLIDAINNFSESYETETGKKLDQKYFVCNQDEPYAQKVIDIILKK